MYSCAISSERFATLSSHTHRLDLRCLFGHSIDDKEVASEVSPQSTLRRLMIEQPAKVASLIEITRYE
jgi:hypothetical protein